MSKRTKIVVGAGIAILGVLATALLWWSWRDEGPEAVDLEAAVALMVSSNPSDGAGRSPSDTDQEPIPATRATRTTELQTSTTSATTTEITTNPVTSTTSTTVGKTTATTADASITSSNDTTTENLPTTGTGSSTEAETLPINAETAGLAGVWTVLTTENADALSSDDDAISFAGYRVVEVLAGGIGESTVVGRTPAVTGSIELRGADLVAAKVEVEMAKLRTDDSHRDSHARKSLNTGEFPLAVFTLTDQVELPAAIFEGERFSGSATGDLTIKGVTVRAVFDLEAQLVGDTIVAVGSTEVLFSDYGVTAPTSASVISVEDHGIMEFQLFFTR